MKRYNLIAIVFGGCIAGATLFAFSLPPTPTHRQWSQIIIHHSATISGNAASFDRYHKSLGWDGLGYHFVIGNGRGAPDGDIHVGWRWLEQREGAHTRGHNDALGICLVGDFRNGRRPTTKQWTALVRLIRRLEKQYGVMDVTTHNQLGQTYCPGFTVKVNRGGDK